MSTSKCHPWIGYKWSKYLLGSTHLICIIFSTSYESMHVPCVYVQSTTYHVNTWNPKIIIFWICRFKKTGMTIIHDLGVLVCAHKLVHIQQRESSPKILYQFSIADQHARIFQADIAWNWPAPWLHFWMDGLFFGDSMSKLFQLFSEDGDQFWRTKIFPGCSVTSWVQITTGRTGWSPFWDDFKCQAMAVTALFQAATWPNFATCACDKLTPLSSGWGAKITECSWEPRESW